MPLSSEAIKLEELRQQIEAAEYESGSNADFLDRGNPNPSQKKQAEELIRQKNAEAAALKTQLRSLIQNTPRPVIEEWVQYHTDILQSILSENSKDINAGARKNVAKETMDNWQAVLNGTKEYVGINWYFLKDYREKVKIVSKPKNKGWKFW
jgi:hypothetical protein